MHATPHELEGQVIMVQAEDLLQTNKLIPDLSMCIQCFTLYVNVSMEVDTRVALSVISKLTYRELWPKPELAPTLKPSTVKLTTYTGESITVKGTIDVHVTYREQESRLKLLIVAGSGPSLMGRDCISQFRLDWENLNTVCATPDSRI